MYTPYDLGTPKKKHTHPPKDMFKNIQKEALLLVASKWRQPKCPVVRRVNYVTQQNTRQIP